MLRGVTTVFRESLDRADTWVERLRVVGLQRQQNPDATRAVEDSRHFREPLPPLNIPPDSPSSLYSYRGGSPTAPRPPLSPSPFAPSPLTSGHSTPYAHLSRSSSTSSFGLPANYFHSDVRSPIVGLDALSLSASTSVNGSRYTTPKSLLSSLPLEGDDDSGTGRREKHGLEGDGDDAAVAAAAALAGMAGSGPRKRQRQERSTDDDGRERMAVDG